MEHKLPPYYSQHGESRYQKQRKRKKFRLRTALEPVLGYLKTDFRMGQNYLRGDNSAKMNALLVAIGWNLKKLMETLEKELLFLFFQITKHFPFLNLYLSKKLTS